jgi:hypothetical protein
MTITTDIPRPRFARMYLKAGARLDRRGVTQHRRRLLEGVAGRVVEVGAGNGLNFAHYPPTATEIVAIEPEPTLRAAAQRLSGPRARRRCPSACAQAPPKRWSWEMVRWMPLSRA